MSEISFPGASAVTSGPAGQDPGPEVTARYEAHALSLIRLAYVVLGDRAAAEDVAQDAFLGLSMSVSIITPDGSSIVCQYSTTIGGGPSAKGPASSTSGFIQYSTKTGKITRVFGVFTYPGQGPGCENSLYWTGPEGETLIASIATPRGIQVGIVSGESFRPLPGITSLGGAAW